MAYNSSAGRIARVPTPIPITAQPNVPNSAHFIYIFHAGGASQSGIAMEKDGYMKAPCSHLETGQSMYKHKNLSLHHVKLTGMAPFDAGNMLLHPAQHPVVSRKYAISSVPDCKTTHTCRYPTSHQGLQVIHPSSLSQPTITPSPIAAMTPYLTLNQWRGVQQHSAKFQTQSKQKSNAPEVSIEEVGAPSPVPGSVQNELNPTSRGRQEVVPVGNAGMRGRRGEAVEKVEVLF